MKTKNNYTDIITTYANPDTDGVCSAIALANYKKITSNQNYHPVFFGKINGETRYVLNHFKQKKPSIVKSIDKASTIILVDTHHKAQISHIINFNNVLEIFDHHPIGNPELFPNAIIQNEKVGAVATLIAEKFKEKKIHPERKIAGLLIGAIISNTLNLVAPSTTIRDRKMIKWLKKIVKFNETMIVEMFERRSNISGMKTLDVLISDYKEFEIKNKKIGMSQIESTELTNFISRKDLLKNMQILKMKNNTDYTIFNGVDIINHKSILIALEPETQQILKNGLNKKFKDSRAMFDRILLRKTDLCTVF